MYIANYDLENLIPVRPIVKGAQIGGRVAGRALVQAGVDKAATSAINRGTQFVKNRTGMKLMDLDEDYELENLSVEDFLKKVKAEVDDGLKGYKLGLKFQKEIIPKLIESGAFDKKASNLKELL